jgi:exonuclease SbcD
VESIPLTAGRRLRDVSGSVEELHALAPELGDAWLRVRVRVETPVPGVAEQVRERLPNAVEVSLEYQRLEARPAAAPTSQLAPSELYRESHRRRDGADPDPRLAALFDSVYEEASRE